MMTTPSLQFSTTSYVYDEYDNGSETDVFPADTNTNSVGAQLSVLYYCMFMFSVGANALVLVIICRFERLTTVTNILLLNLVLSSLVFMGTLPFWGVYQQLQTWVFGRVMCKVVISVYYLGLYSSVLFLTLLTFDRHLAVVYSLGASRLRGQRYAVVSCATVWTLSALACIRPIILHSPFYHRVSKRTHCQEYPGNRTDVDVDLLRASGFYIQLFLFLLFPLVVIIYCYARIAVTVLSSRIATKFQTVRLIFVIVLLFLLCWTPFNVAVLMRDKASTPAERQEWDHVLNVTRYFAYFYCCISPIFYTFVGKKFQNYFRTLLVKRFPRLKRYISVSHVTRTNMSTRSTPNEL
ncbi:C-C chemokine receptor type 1-like [Sphaeramia orbicularis]|uniref:C-C chemokine receptor type 1-like n=1 Tax=Sphaeramia orbicularis TaxID=375764 RepID=A0A672YT40_9TELE|nr:C-C chemokine receptor type 1-like [Sphaeramia orbicularis]